MSPEPVKVVFINCDTVPFLEKIMSFDKLYETRTRNTLKKLIGQRVFLAETHNGKKPMVRCSCVIGSPIVVRSCEAWDPLRSATCIPAGSKYDWKADTKAKYLYPLRSVRSVPVFVPFEGVRHGYVWMDTIVIRSAPLPMSDTDNPDTFLYRFKGKSGAVITIDKHGHDDFSAAWDDTYSVRGRFVDIVEELKGEY